MTPQSECRERNSEEGAAKKKGSQVLQATLRRIVTLRAVGTLTCDVDGPGVLQLRVQTVQVVVR